MNLSKNIFWKKYIIFSRTVAISLESGASDDRGPCLNRVNNKVNSTPHRIAYAFFNDGALNENYILNKSSNIEES